MKKRTIGKKKMPDKKPNPLFLKPDIQLSKGRDGVIYLRSNRQLNHFPDSIMTYLDHWARHRPDTIFLAERQKEPPCDWERMTYREALENSCHLANILQKNTQLATDRPLLILSGNSISSALMMLACHIINVPIVPVSPSYSLLSKDFGKIKYIQQLTQPGLVFAETHLQFQPVLDMLEQTGIPIITADKESPREPILNFTRLLTAPMEKSNPIYNIHINTDDTAKILFTSGSTGMPKGVINTHKMLTSNQEAIARIWPFIEEEGHIFLDWLPWHHTFGGNHNFNMVLRNGGTLYIDGGKPTPEGMKISLKNLSDISPTVYFNVAAGYSMLIDHLEKNEALAVNFFQKLKVLFFAAAALPAPLWKRLQLLIDKYAPINIPITSSWGATETAPACTSVHFSNKLARNIGVPLPGTDIKLIPYEDMMELRVKGPNIMPGYFQNAEQTKAAFDEEGYFKSGDAVELIDPDNPSKGLLFMGRISENFKLQTGTWVNVGDLRIALLEVLSPLATDIVICGHDKSDIAIMIFPNLPACLKYARETAPEEIMYNKDIQNEICRRLQAYNSSTTGSSKCIKKFLILTSPPSIDANEITDKGYLNQRGVINNRPDHVASLYTDNNSHGVVISITPDKDKTSK